MTDPISIKESDSSLKGELHPNRNWACFKRYLKIIQNIWKVIFLLLSKLFAILAYGSRTAWPTKI